MHLKDVMKKLIEQEKAKLKLADVINNMKDETDRFFYAYLLKNIEVRMLRDYKYICLENRQNISFFKRKTGKDSDQR